MKIIINGEVVEVGGGGGSEDAYSTEETRIGTWIDGKPLYRKTFIGTFGPNDTSRYVIADVRDLSIDVAISANGFAITNNNYNVFLPNAATSTYAFTDVFNNTLGVKTNNPSLFNRPVTIFLEYTKTTGQAESAT